MAILAECPICHRKQATKNKVCSCGENLDRAKRSKRVKYWISYYLPGKKQKREAVGYSIEEARDAHAKRRSQKREEGDRFYEVLRENKVTVKELSKWFLSLQTVKQLPSYSRYCLALDRFNEVLGDKLVRDLRPIDLEDYQAARMGQGRAPATVENEVGTAQTMVMKADDNDMIDPRAVKVFRRRKKALRHGDNARDRVITINEYLRLLGVSVPHLRTVLIIAMNTGMRTGEILALKWSYIDRDKWMIRLPAEVTKEKRPKSIPINKTVRELLQQLPRVLHQDHVITYRGQPITMIHTAFRNTCKRAGISQGNKTPDGIVFHDMRRSVKTYMARAGVDKVYRDTILGHSLKGMDVYYMKPSDEDLHAAMEKYTAWLSGELACNDQSNDQIAVNP